MWSVIQEILQHYDLIGLLVFIEAAIIFWLYKKGDTKENECTKCRIEFQETLTKLGEKRLEDANKRLEDSIEDRERYEDLAKELTSNISILIASLIKKDNELLMSTLRKKENKDS